MRLFLPVLRCSQGARSALKKSVSSLMSSSGGSTGLTPVSLQRSWSHLSLNLEREVMGLRLYFLLLYFSCIHLGTITDLSTADTSGYQNP